MKTRYELQIKRERWVKDPFDVDFVTLDAKVRECERVGNLPPFDKQSFRVVKKQGNKIIKVVYPKESK